MNTRVADDTRQAGVEDLLAANPQLRAYVQARSAGMNEHAAWYMVEGIPTGHAEDMHDRHGPLPHEFNAYDDYHSHGQRSTTRDDAYDDYPPHSRRSNSQLEGNVDSPPWERPTSQFRLHQDLAAHDTRLISPTRTQVAESPQFRQVGGAIYERITASEERAQRLAVQSDRAYTGTDNLKARGKKTRVSRRYAGSIPYGSHTKGPTNDQTHMARDPGFEGRSQASGGMNMSARTPKHTRTSHGQRSDDMAANRAMNNGYSRSTGDQEIKAASHSTGISGMMATCRMPEQFGMNNSPHMAVNRDAIDNRRMVEHHDMILPTRMANNHDRMVNPYMSRHRGSGGRAGIVNALDPYRSSITENPYGMSSFDSDRGFAAGSRHLQGPAPYRHSDTYDPYDMSSLTDALTEMRGQQRATSPGVDTYYAVNISYSGGPTINSVQSSHTRSHTGFSSGRDQEYNYYQ